MNTSLLPETIYLIDSNSSLVGEWASEFKDYPSIIPLDEDYFCKPADCIVSLQIVLVTWMVALIELSSMS